MNEALKACPFCGGENIASYDREFESHWRTYIRCVGCDYEMSAMAQARGDATQQAKVKWNTRAAEAVGGDLEQLWLVVNVQDTPELEEAFLVNWLRGVIKIPQRVKDRIIAAAQPSNGAGLEKVREALDELGNHNHFDHTMQSGAGCQTCIRQRELRKEALAELSRQQTAPTEWRPITEAPRDESLFLCRHKAKPHVTFEAAIFKEDDGWESGNKPYDVIQNMTTDEPIDADWDDLEWQPLPAAPSEVGGE